ncbi:ATP-binding protein [Streptomyces sp. NPDC048606]|uniref:ATP-binding protein n=1 Tax=Streptomyces sp. NPDC048606 TaxID=3154726 RepID=UPI0034164368
MVDLSGLEAPQRVARDMVRGMLANAPADLKDDVVLVADELVGNAFEHAGEALGISVGVYAWGTVVQVHDSGRDTDRVSRSPARAGHDDVRGRGLLLVNALSSAWQVQVDDAGKRVVAVFLHRADGTY